MSFHEYEKISKIYIDKYNLNPIGEGECDGRACLVFASKNPRTAGLFYEISAKVLATLRKSCPSLLGDNTKVSDSALAEVFTISLIYGILRSSSRLDPKPGFSRYSFLSTVERSISKFSIFAGAAIGLEAPFCVPARRASQDLLIALTTAGAFVVESKASRDGKKTKVRSEARLLPNVKYETVDINHERLFSAPRDCLKLFGSVYVTGHHFVTLSSVTLPNKKSSSHSVMLNEGFVKRIMATPHKLNLEVLGKNISVLLEKAHILSGAQMSSDKLAEEIRSRYREAAEIILAARNAYQSTLAEDSTDDSKKNAGVRWGSEKIKAAEIQQKASCLLEAYEATRAMEFAQKHQHIYFDYRLDFRGRLYCYTTCGYTTNKAVRFAMQHSGGSAREQNSALWEYVRSAYGCSEATPKQRALFVEMCVERGKLRKKDIKGAVTKLSLATLGAGLMLLPEEGTSDRMELNGILEGVRQIREEGDCFMYAWCDATASGLQMCGAFFGVEAEAYAKGFNLRREDGEWSDAYEVMIEAYRSKTPPEPAIAHLITRSLLKKTIMILNYNGTLHTCLTSVREALVLKCSESDRSGVIKYVQGFYRFALRAVTERGEVFSRSIEDLGLLGGDVPSGAHGLRGGACWAVSDAEGDIRFREHNDDQKKAASERVEALSSAMAEARKLSTPAALKRLRELGFDSTLKFVQSSIKGRDSKKLYKMAMERLEFELAIARPIAEGSACEPAVCLIAGDGFKSYLSYELDASYRRDIREKAAGRGWVSALVAKYSDLYINPRLFTRRQTFCEFWASGSSDHKATERAARANFTHFLDAIVLRGAISQLHRVDEPCLPIHDCIGCRPHARETVCAAYRDGMRVFDIVVNRRRFFVRSDITAKWVLL